MRHNCLRQIRLYTTELSSIDEFKPTSIDKASTLQHLLNLILADFYTHPPCTPCSANVVNSKEQQLGLCAIQKIDPRRHPTKEGTVLFDIDSIQESVATVTIPADVVRLPQHTTYSNTSYTCNNYEGHVTTNDSWTKGASIRQHSDDNRSYLGLRDALLTLMILLTNFYVQSE
ncbi:hypothetical protein Tco_1448188 [Tanacetum coccineum]